MAKKPKQIMYRALVNRNETNGEVNRAGDVTALKGMTGEEIAYLIGNGYYVALDELPDDIRRAAGTHGG